jgi:hypothetical protein
MEKDCIMTIFITCTLPRIIRIIRSRRMKLSRHVDRMEEKRNAYRILWESQREGHNKEDLNVGGRIKINGS